MISMVCKILLYRISLVIDLSDPFTESIAKRNFKKYINSIHGGVDIKNKCNY